MSTHVVRGRKAAREVPLVPGGRHGASLRSAREVHRGGEGRRLAPASAEHALLRGNAYDGTPDAFASIPCLE